MREYFRPYNKAVTLAADAATAINVELSDSAGAPLACNYISVEALSGQPSARGFFQIIPSGVNTIFGAASAADGGSVSSRDSGPVSYPNAILRTSNEVSGGLGIIASTNSQAILSLAPYDATKAIILSHVNTAEVTYGITYGQVNLANSRADVAVDMDEVTYTSAIADFTYASGVNGASTSAFTFTDTSEGNPIAWLWDFNFVAAAGVSTSTKQNPTFDYTGVTGPIGKSVKLIITTLHSAAQGPAKAETKVLA